jgi:hypothetical protein
MAGREKDIMFGIEFSKVVILSVESVGVEIRFRIVCIDVPMGVLPELINNLMIASHESAIPSADSTPRARPPLLPFESLAAPL